jgi:hypothetical protein
MSNSRVITVTSCLLIAMLFGIILVVRNRKYPVDCTANTEAMAVWLTDCAYDPCQSTPGCVEAAEKIFCKPVCQE